MMRAEAMRLTLFDLDNTLLSGDSDYGWGQFAIRHRLVDAATYEVKNAGFYAAYQQGNLDQMAYLEFCLEPLTHRSRDELDDWHRRFMTETIEPMMSAAGKSLVRQRLDAGDVVAVVTSTNSFITGPIARAYSIPSLIATEAELDGDRYTGRIVGVPAFRGGKVERVHGWLAARGEQLADYAEIWFYSDSTNDLPLLEAVTHPVVVDPDDGLRAIALSRGWPLVSLRDG